jgi:hypothetical protein
MTKPSPFPRPVGAIITALGEAVGQRHHKRRIGFREAEPAEDETVLIEGFRPCGCASTHGTTGNVHRQIG